LGVSDQIQMLGYRRDVPQLLMQTQICVLSTHYEGMPLALIEGMAAGCAVVGSAVPGVRELISHGVTGELVAPGDALALADSLEGLLRRPERALMLGRAARQRALAEHGRALMVSRYDELLREIVSGSADGSIVPTTSTERQG
jgi:glycosyltransferase involved in cell wall biosynthesis